MSTLASIFYEDNEHHHVHVAHETLDDAIYVEIGDKCEPASCVTIPYEEAIEMASKILGYANWPNLINTRNMRRR